MEAGRRNSLEGVSCIRGISRLRRWGEGEGNSCSGGVSRLWSVRKRGVEGGEGETVPQPNYSYVPSALPPPPLNLSTSNEAKFPLSSSHTKAPTCAINRLSRRNPNPELSYRRCNGRCQGSWIQIWRIPAIVQGRNIIL